MKSKLFYLLLAKNSSENKTELESETIPYTFKSNGHRLRNYRIYGAEGGVGDLDSTTGKYIIPIEISGNLFDENYLVNVTKRFCTLSVSNHTINLAATKNDAYFGDVPTDGQRYSSTMGQRIPCSVGQTYYVTISNNGINKNYVTFIDENGVRVNSIKFTTSSFSFTVPFGAKYMFFRIGKQDSVAGDVYQFTVTVAKIPMSIFEPYHEAQTFNIYLDEPLGEDEYIDFREQKRFNSDDSTEIVSLPAILTIDGTNIISVETTVQPSKIYLQGGIEEMLVSLQMSSPLNLQSLQPLSLDSMPIDRSELINDISEVPVEDENPVEEIPEAENFETSGDEENAE